MRVGIERGEELATFRDSGGGEAGRAVALAGLSPTRFLWLGLIFYGVQMPDMQVQMSFSGFFQQFWEASVFYFGGKRRIYPQNEQIYQL